MMLYIFLDYYTYAKKLVDYNRHIGIYAFLKQSLIEFSNLKRLNLEILENLEGNRVVENSKKLRW